MTFFADAPSFHLCHGTTATAAMDSQWSTDLECPPLQICRCFIPNRGLYSCQFTQSNGYGEYALAPAHSEVAFEYFERPGLRCEPTLPFGAVPMSFSPPLANIEGIVDLQSPACPERLHEWAVSLVGGAGFYELFTYAANVIPILAAPGVTDDQVAQASQLISKLMMSAVSPHFWLEELMRENVRVALAPEGEASMIWRQHPEVHQNFATGLGGASKLFPTVGAQVDGSCDGWLELLEEFFHTIQYIVLRPYIVCLYHIAFAEAVAAGRYRPVELEQDGEPVPTMQADEYFASAFIVWFGGVLNSVEYRVAGNGPSGTGRQNLHTQDPLSFCLLAQLFRANDTWTPCSSGNMKRFPNIAVDYDSAQCDRLLMSRARTCPGTNTSWPISVVHTHIANSSWRSGSLRDGTATILFHKWTTKVTSHASSDQLRDFSRCTSFNENMSKCNGPLQTCGFDTQFPGRELDSNDGNRGRHGGLEIRQKGVQHESPSNKR